MKVWILTEMYDDADPGDHANLFKVTVFSDLMEVRRTIVALLGDPEADLGYPMLRPMQMVSDEDDEDEMLGAELEEYLIEPERYTWTSGDKHEGWSGGSIVQVWEREF